MSQSRDERKNQWRDIRVRMLPAVLRKTGGRCFYCGISVSNQVFIDHFVPTCRGGSDDLSNLVPACGSCNSAKGPRPLATWRRIRHWQLAADFGIPRFNNEQAAWLKGHGFDPLANVPVPTFWFEQQGIAEPEDLYVEVLL